MSLHIRHDGEGIEWNDSTKLVMLFQESKMGKWRGRWSGDMEMEKRQKERERERYGDILVTACELFRGIGDKRVANGKLVITDY